MGGGMGMAQSGAAPKKTVRSLMVGSRVKFHGGKSNLQSRGSARRENSPRAGSRYKVGTRIRFK